MSAGFVGTLRYAAPEQFSSAKDAVGPATDVRGLGVTLWELLTQKTLFAEAEDERQLSALVQDVDVPRLRSVDANFDRDLEAIVARATERRREDRIQSARDLAEYLTLYLDGKPIPIRTPGLTEMLMRWVRENKAIVATAAAASLLILVTVIAAFVLINQARLKEMAAKEQERAAKITAQENFEMARGAVEKYFTRVSENRLLNEPGMQALRNELLEDALAFNRRFIEQYRDDPRVQRDLAIAYFNLGRVVEDIGQSDEAIRQYESAREVQQRLRKAQPEDLQLVTQLALTWNAIGRSRQRASQLAAALKAYEEAAGLRERLVQGEPDNAEYHRLLANAHMNVGLIQFRRGKLDPAEAGIRKAQALRKQQLEARQLEVQEQRAIRRDYGMGWYNLANLKLNQDDVQAADSLVQQAIASFAQLHQQQPTEIMSQYRLAQCYRLLADTKDDLGEAIDAYAKAETHMAKLSSENPLLGSLAMELAQIRVELGNLHLEAEKLAVAAGHFEAAIEGLRKLRQKSPEFAPYAENLALALQGDGDRHIAQKQWASARARLQESLDLWQDLLKQRPGDSFYEENRDAAQKSLKALAGKKATALQ